MKKLLLGMAIAVAVLAAVAALLAWRESGERAERERDALVRLREEAGQLVKFCELAAFPGKIEMGTANFGRYFATDLARAGKVLHDVVGPVLDAQELACTSAKTDLDLLQGHGEPDRWVEQQSTYVAINIAKMRVVRAAYDRLAQSLARGADRTELAAALDALRSSSH